MFSTFCSYFRVDSINLKIDLTKDLQVLTPAAAKMAIDSTKMGYIYQMILVGGSSVLVSGLGALCIHHYMRDASDEGGLVMGVALIVFGGVIVATSYQNYRYYQTVHLPKLQKIASQV